MKSTRPLKLLVAVAVLALFATLVIGAAPQHLKPTHYFHVVEMGSGCEDCHVDAMAGKVATMPGHDQCAGCHGDPMELDCEMCHIGDPQVITPERSYEDFSHATHSGEECAVCHAAIEDEGDRPVLVGGQAECQLCHSVEMKEAPADHLAGMWHEEHGFEAQMADSDCGLCHAAEDCAACHQGTDIYGSGMSAHPPEFLYDHDFDASFGGQCTTCHESTTECTTCHRAMLPVPHGFGPDFANVNGGGTHVDEAKSWPETCVVCHDLGENDPTCANCHE